LQTRICVYLCFGVVTLMEVKTPREFFEKVMPLKFDPSKAMGIDCVVQMSLTGENGCDWVIIIKNQKIEIKEGTHKSPTVTVKMKDIDYVNMANGKLSGERAFMTGKLKFKGSIATALKLKALGIL
jgi:putative sterol carrier protein